MTERKNDISRDVLLAELGHSLLEQSPIPLAELEGAQHLIWYVNPAFCRLVVKDRDALLGRPFSEAVPEGHRCLEVLDRVYRTGRPDLHAETKPTEPHPFFWSYVMWPVLDAQEGTVGVML